MLAGMDSSTSSRTTGAKRCSRSSSAIISTRSSASSSLRVNDGVACHTERVGGHDLHALEERVQVVDDDLFQRHKMERVVQRHPARPAGRHLDAGEARLVADRIAQDDGQAQAQVADKGEGMAGIDGQRRQDRIDLALR